MVRGFLVRQVAHHGCDLLDFLVISERQFSKIVRGSLSVWKEKP